jgi:hypothetical protein
MSFQDHLKICSYCNSNKDPQPQKVTVSIKSASSYYNQKKLSDLAAIIKGTSYPGISYLGVRTRANGNTRTKTKTKTKGASNTGNVPRKSGLLERQFKLKELARLIRGV